MHGYGYIIMHLKKSILFLHAGIKFCFFFFFNKSIHTIHLGTMKAHKNISPTPTFASPQYIKASLSERKGTW